MSNQSVEQLHGVDIVDRDFLNKVIGVMLFRDVDDELTSVFQKITDVDFWDISLSDAGDSKTYRTLLKVITSLRLQGHSPHVIKEKLSSHQKFSEIIHDVEINKEINDTHDTLEVLKNKIKTFLLYRFLVDCNQNITGRLVSGKTVDDYTFTETIKKIEGLYSGITFDHIASESTYSDETTIDARFQNRLDKITGKKHGHIIETGIELVDASFNNQKGMESGCIYMVSAPYGIGKTRFVTAVGANSYINGYNTYHITIENKKEQVEALYDIALTGVTIEEIYSTLLNSENDEDAKAKLNAIKGCLHEVYASHPNVLEIKKFQPYKTSAALIENFIKRKMSSGSPKPDILIVDHMDIMLPNQGFVSDLFQRGELIVGELKDLAERYQLVILVPTQIGREGVRSNRTNKNSATSGGESVSRSLAKNELVDFHATLNQNDEENVKNLMRIFIDKNREGWGRVVIPIHFDKGKLRITSLTKENELQDFDETVLMHVNRLLIRAGKGGLSMTNENNLENFNQASNHLSSNDPNLDSILDDHQESMREPIPDTIQYVKDEVDVPETELEKSMIPEIPEKIERKFGDDTEEKSNFNNTLDENDKSKMDDIGVVKKTYSSIQEFLNKIVSTTDEVTNIFKTDDTLVIEFINNSIEIELGKILECFDAFRVGMTKGQRLIMDMPISQQIMEILYDDIPIDSHPEKQEID